MAGPNMNNPNSRHSRNKERKIVHELKDNRAVGLDGE